MSGFLATCPVEQSFKLLQLLMGNSIQKMVTDQIHERVNADELKYPPDGENKEITETPLPTDNKLLDQPTPSPAGTVLPSPPDSGPPLETPTKDNQLRCAQTQRIPPPQRVKLTEEELLKIHRERAARGEGFLEMYGLMKKSTISFTSVPDAAGGIESPSSEYAQRLNSLSDEQRRLIDFVDRGANVFFTGSAGTGKSYTLQTIVEHLKRKGKSVCVTAPTGIAATQVNRNPENNCFYPLTNLIDRRKDYSFRCRTWTREVAASSIGGRNYNKEGETRRMGANARLDH